MFPQLDSRINAICDHTRKLLVTDDFPNNASTTGRFATNLSTTGVFNSDLGENDSDWFRIALTEGTTYLLRAQTDFLTVPFNVDIEQLNGDGFIEDRDSRGFFNDETGESSPTESIWFTAARTGDFLFSVNAESAERDLGYTVSALVYEIPDFFSTRVRT